MYIIYIIYVFIYHDLFKAINGLNRPIVIRPTFIGHVLSILIFARYPASAYLIYIGRYKAH